MRCLMPVTPRSIALSTAAAAVALGGALAPAAQASPATPSASVAADARNGHCEKGEFCYSFNSDFKGSISDFKASIPDLGATQPTCYEFKGAGNGKGQCVKNHAAAVRNLTDKPVTVFFNSNYGGASQTVKPGQTANLKPALKNNNASHRIGGGDHGPGVIGDDYPYKGQSSGVDPWNFYKGQCTSFAAWRVNHVHGVKFHNHYKGQHWGNAEHWAAAARAGGVTVTKRPKAGDIAQRTTGTYGHVAYVAKVNPNGSFVVEEYNHVHANKYSVRTATIGTGSDQFNNFIRFKG